MFFKADRINVTTLYIDKRDRLLFNLLCIVQGLICFYYLTFQQISIHFWVKLATYICD